MGAREFRDRGRPRVDARDPSDEETSVTCSISEEFIGSVVTLFLEAADGTEFKVQLQERALEALGIEPGASYALSWRPDAAHLLPSGGRTP